MSTQKNLITLCVAAVFALGLAACGSGGDSKPTTGGPGEPDPAIAQRADIKTKIMAAQTAVNAVDNESTDAEVTAAENAVAAAKTAITAAANVPAEEKAADTRTVTALETQLSGAKTARKTAMDDADMEAKMAMMATAMKLHMGIGAPTAADATPGRHAAYDTDGNVAVTIGTADAAGTAVALMEDKKTMVAANHGWMGKRYTASEGMYEAVVYSNMGAPTPGKKFGGAAANDEFEYALTDGELAVDTSDAAVAGRVASSSFDQSAGMKMFKLPANSVRVMIPGSYHGVSGSYNCTPADDGMCSATVAAMGFTLQGGTWTFKPTDANAMVMSVPDMIYASYGWWIHKSADGKMFTASAFVDDMGEVPAASGIDDLRGTATYMGGAAGKYALYSATGGTNDAGHFTAKAMLEADFNTDMVSGTIDDFMGADGMARNWSVELKKSGVGATGNIAGADGADDATPMMTMWTIDGTAAAAAGQWSGMLKDNGDDGVPKVATGTFYSMYGVAGKMVGGFGVNKQ